MIRGKPGTRPPKVTTRPRNRKSPRKPATAPLRSETSMTIAGIDLGTTNSLIATWTDEGPRLIANALGDTLTPSAVSIADDGAVLIGARRSIGSSRIPIARSPRSSAGWDRAPARVWPASSTARRNCRAGAALAEGGRRQPGRRRIADTVISVPAYFSDPQRHIETKIGNHSFGRRTWRTAARSKRAPRWRTTARPRRC